MKRLVTREKDLITRSSSELWFRRINWKMETRHRVRRALESVVVAAKTSGYPFQLYVQEFEQPNEGLIQLSAGQNPTGVVNREECFDLEHGSWNRDTSVMESGAGLVVSQSVTGHVHFTVNLYACDRIRPRRQEVLLFVPLDPASVTERRVMRAVRLFFLFVRDSSVYGISGSRSFSSRALLAWIRFRDLRSRYKLVRSLASLKNEWAKAVFAAILALVVTIVAATAVRNESAGSSNASKPTSYRGSTSLGR